jgi:hypothetical protein
MDKGEELIQEYRKIGVALSNWFISQEIAGPRAAGAMCYLTGVIIGKHAKRSGNAAALAAIALELHQQVMKGGVAEALED